MTARDDLGVWFGAQRVAHLRVDEHGRLHLRYDAAWLADPRAFAVSLSLPLRAEEHPDASAHPFFANLLPEGSVRAAVARRLGLSEDNDVALLRAIGGECAGALSIADAATPPVAREPEYELLSDRRLQTLATSDRVVPLLVGGATTRLSLAGVQDKLPVAVLDGRIHLPLASAPSTHILKLPSPRFAHIAANEAFVTGLAARIGLDVVRAELMTRTDPPSLLVERYDRVATDDPWPALRLHQEDLCQALGLPPARKYEQEGGPSLAAVISIVRANVAQPLLDTRRIIEWQTLNVIAGNSDGHGKNLSLLHTAEGLRLAPFYDLLSTRAHGTLDRNLAMSVGTRRDPDHVARADWEALGTALQLVPRVVIELATGVVERCRGELAAWTRAFREMHGELPVLQTLPRQIARRAAKVLRALS